MEFISFPKIPRLNREVIVTEKIDGTNACIIIEAVGSDVPEVPAGSLCTVIVGNGDPLNNVAYVIGAQSRNRLLTLTADNAGFARWVYDNAQQLVELLGEGRHFGEWWGKGIQRGYGQSGKNFSLFNVKRWEELNGIIGGVVVSCVPVLARLPAFGSERIATHVNLLRLNGSVVAPGQPAEGVVVFHVASGHTYKVLCEGDEVSKGEAGVS